MRVTVLGAGAMGSAFAAAAANGGHEVTLWGTHLDTDIVRQLRDGRPHPKTHATLPTGVCITEDAQLHQSMRSAELIVLAVTSDGALPVATRAIRSLTDDAVALLILTKGFAVVSDGRVELLSVAIRALLPSASGDLAVIDVGGPCKANEVAAGQPTFCVMAADRPGIAVEVANRITTDSFVAVASDDIVGVEVAAALKNLYAVALGVCDGLLVSGAQPWHDLRAALFTQSISEMRWIVTVLGGRAETILGLAGVGDLEVTALSGRNRAFGERLGRGETVRAARDAMADSGLVVEGLAVAELARRLVIERTGSALLGQLPLFDLLTGALAQMDQALEDASRRFAKAAFVGLRQPSAVSEGSVHATDAAGRDTTTAIPHVAGQVDGGGHATAKGGRTHTD